MPCAASMLAMTLSFPPQRAQGLLGRAHLFCADKYKHKDGVHINSQRLSLLIAATGAALRGGRPSPTAVPARGLQQRAEGVFFDLTGLAKVHWHKMVTGFRRLRLIVKRADGTLLDSSGSEGASADWRETESVIADQRLCKLDPKVMNDGAWVENPDLTKVDEIGRTDLAACSGHGSGGAVSSSRIGWIEDYGLAVNR